MLVLILFFLLSISFSFLCSIWEAVLLSISPSFIKRMASEGNSAAPILEDFKRDIDRPLSAILTLNTIAHTVGAIGVGAQAGAVFGTNSLNIFGFSLSYEAIIAFVMTLAILILSEIIPKTIGANNWKQLAGFTARSLKVIIYLLYPLVMLSQLITRSLKKNKGESVLSRSDFRAMAEVAGESGEINKSEYAIINNLLDFEVLTAKDIMTPRTVMVTADENMSIAEFHEKHRPHIFSRIPLYNGSTEPITGVLLKDELLSHLVDGESNVKLGDIKRPAAFVPIDMKLPLLMDKLSESKQHMAIVVNEFGGVEGLVSLEDVVETLFGKEILDETDTVADMQAYARKKWEERAKKLGLIQGD